MGEQIAKVVLEGRDGEPDTGRCPPDSCPLSSLIASAAPAVSFRKGMYVASNALPEVKPSNS